MATAEVVPNVQVDPAAGGATVDPGTGGGATTTPEVPKSFSFSFEEGDEPVEVPLEGVEAEEAGPKELKFEDLKSYFKDDDPAHQETYKSLKRPLSEYGRYKKTFETPEAATQHMEKLGELNRLVQDAGIKDAKGLEGIEQYITANNRVLNGISTGDPEIAKTLFANNPAGMAKFVEAASDHWYKADAPGWAKHHADVMWSTITKPDSNGVTALAALQQAYNKTDEPEVKALLEKIGETFGTIKRATDYKGPAGAQDPTTVAERNKNQADAQKNFNDRAEFSVDRIVSEASSKTLGQMLSQAKISGLSKEDRGKALSFLSDTFSALVKNDADTKSKLDAAFAAKDLTKMESIIKGVKSRFMVEASKQLWKKQLGPKKGDVRNAAGNKKEATGGGSNAGAVKYAGELKNFAPPSELMDFPRMRAKDAESNGKTSMLENRTFYMKGKNEVHYW